MAHKIGDTLWPLAEIRAKLQMESKKKFGSSSFQAIKQFILLEYSTKEQAP